MQHNRPQPGALILAFPITPLYPSVATEEIAYAVAVFVSAANGTLFARQFSSPTSKAKRECEDLFITLYSAAASTEAEAEPTQEGSLYTSFRVLWEQYQGDARQSSICARVLAFYFLMERTRGTVVEQWLRPCPDAPEAVVLDKAVVAAIASVALGEGGLQEDQFRSAVKDLAERRSDQEVPTDNATPAADTFTDPPVQAATQGSVITGNLAERPMAYEAAGKDFSEEKISAAIAVCEKLRQPLTALAGKEAFRALLTRALTLSKREAPALEGARVKEDGSLEGIDQAPIHAITILIRHLVRLPASVIGDTLTFRLLREVWPDLASFEEGLLPRPETKSQT